MLPNTATLDNETSEGLNTNSILKKPQNYAPRRLQNSVCSNGDGIDMKVDFFNDVNYTLGRPEYAINFDLDDLATWTDQDCGDRSI